MAFTMIYHKRNMDNIAKLADNTKLKALQWYKYCIDNKLQVLIYETIRTKEQQAENVRKGVSKTMQSYHLVGQAFDFVFVDQKGNALWNKSEYTKRLHVIKYAKSIGFVSGYDWGWDAPHMQYEYTGYGKDTFKNNVNVYTYLNKLSTNESNKSVSQNTQPTKERKIKMLKDATSTTLINDFIKDLEKALSTGKITNKKWIEQAKNGTMTLADAMLLMNYINK